MFHSYIRHIILIILVLVRMCVDIFFYKYEINSRVCPISIGIPFPIMKGTFSSIFAESDAV